MAELVDALVSNTNEAIRAGSIPARSTRQRRQSVQKTHCRFFCLSYPSDKEQADAIGKVADPKRAGRCRRPSICACADGRIAQALFACLFRLSKMRMANIVSCMQTHKRSIFLFSRLNVERNMLLFGL